MDQSGSKHIAVDVTDPNFKKSILNYMVRDKSFALGCIDKIQTDFFSDQYDQYFFQKIKDYIIKYDYVPTSFALQQMLADTPAELRSLYHQVLQIILTTGGQTDKQLVIDGTEKFVKDTIITKYVDEISGDILANNQEEAVVKAGSMIEEVNAVSFSKGTALTGNDFIGMLDSAEEDVERPVPVGVRDIDKDLGGGAAPSELLLFAGDANVGKSICLSHMAIQALQHGRNVLFVYAEGKKKQLPRRLASRYTGIDYNRIRENWKYWNEQDEERSKVSAFFREINEKIFVEKTNESNSNMTDVRAMFQYYYDNYGVTTLILDYVDLYHPGDDYKESAPYLLQDESCRRLSSIANDFDSVAISATQLKRPTESKVNSGQAAAAHDIADSYGKIRKADVILGLARTPDMIEADEILLNIIKNRDNVKGRKTLCQTKYEKMLPFGGIKESHKGEGQ